MMEQEKSMETIQRYRVGRVLGFDSGYPTSEPALIKHEQGDAVLYADHIAALAAKDAAIAALKGAVHADVKEFTRDSATLEAQSEQIRVLREHIHELLHWIYPREGDPEHRTDQFVAEAIIGFMLLGEDHPFEKAEKDEEAARAALASTAPVAEAPKCDCHMREKQVCNICQNVDGGSK